MQLCMVKMREIFKEEYWFIKSHHYKKYNILKKYLEACKKFQRKYRNFVYIETHGGSGLVYDIEKKRIVEGSPVIARKSIDEAFPCYIIEIKERRFKKLEECMSNYPNVKLLHGDCNQKIFDIFDEIEKWKFKLCFLDPDGLVEEETHCPQLKWKTVEFIGKNEKTELLLNFPLEAIIRLQGYIVSKDDSKTEKFKEIISTFMPYTDEWIGETDRRKLLEIYMKHLKKFYPYTGAFLVKTSRNVPQYYLIYASKHEVGAKIMRDIMKIECFGKGQKSLDDVDAVYPTTHFVFEYKF